MSAIGDYIHLTKQGYLTHGTTRNSRKFKPWRSQRGIIRARAKSNKSPLTKLEKESLEQTISSILTMDPGTSRIANAQYGMVNILNQQFQKRTRMLNWNTGGMEWEDNEKENVIGKIHRHRDEQNQLRLDFNKAKEKVEKLLLIVSNKIDDSSFEGRDVIKDIDSLKIYLKQLDEKIRNNLDKNGWSLDIQEMTDYELMQKINKLIEYYAAYPAINAQQGLAFEAAIAMAPYVAQGMAYEEAASQIVGSLKEKVEINTKKFASFIQKEIGPDTFLETSGSSSAGKIDVKIKWNNKIAKISAKNVNLSGSYTWVHIVSGSSLLYLLQDLNGDFINHFLNLIAHHDDEKSEGNLTIKRKSIMQEIKLFLFYKALTGSNYGRSTADTFVINDNSKKGGIRVYCMNDIVESVLNNNLVKDISVTTPIAGEVGNIRLKNELVENDETGGKRILNLLQEAHQHKIFVKFNAPNVLRSL